MALNPRLDDGWAPVAFPGEQVLCTRRDVELSCTSDSGGLPPTGAWRRARGQLHCTSVRLVFVADPATPGTTAPTAGGMLGWMFRRPPAGDQGHSPFAPSDGSSGGDGGDGAGALSGVLEALDFPLAFIAGERFVQPILGPNSLEFYCASVAHGGPDSGVFLKAVLSFPTGGVGTLLPMFVMALSRARSITHFVPATDTTFAPRRGARPPVSVPTRLTHEEGEEARGTAHRPIKLDEAYIDPGDPTTLHLAARTPSSAPSAPPLQKAYPKASAGARTTDS